MAYVRFGVPKDADRTALEVEIHGSPGPLLDAARDRDADQVTEAFKGIELHANSAVYTLEKVNDFSIGANSYTATFSNGGKKLFVKVPKHGSSRFAAPKLPEGTPCDVIATSIAAKSKKDIATGIQIMEMGIGDLFNELQIGGLSGNNVEVKQKRREVVRWMYDAARCLLDNKLVATDWKTENIAVMSYEPLTLRLIDVDSFYSLDAPSAGFYMGTPCFMPVMPLVATSVPSPEFRAQMVLTMAWAVVVNAVDVAFGGGDPTGFQPDGVRRWNENEFFSRVKRIAQHGFHRHVWESFEPYWEAYQRYPQGIFFTGWTRAAVAQWVEFVKGVFEQASAPQHALRPAKRSREASQYQADKKAKLLAAGFADLCV